MTASYERFGSGLRQRCAGCSGRPAARGAWGAAMALRSAAEARHLGAPQPVALLEPEAPERAPAAGDDPERPARLPERVPQLQPHVGRRVQLPAELADVRQPERRDRDIPDVRLAPTEVTEAGRREAGSPERPDEGP